MADSAFKNFLKKFKVGEKSKYQLEREATPGMNWVGTRGGPSFNDIKAQEEINRQAGVNLRRFDGKLKSGEKLRNIGGVTYVVPAPSAAPVDSAPPVDYRIPGLQDGPITQGMFSPIEDNQQSMFGDYLQQQRTEPETTTDIVSKELAKITGTGQYEYAQSPGLFGIEDNTFGGYSQGLGKRSDIPDNPYPQSVPFDQPLFAGLLSQDNMNQAREEIEQRNQENRDAYAARGEELRQQYLNRDNKRTGPSEFESSSFNQRKAKEEAERLAAERAAIEEYYPAMPYQGQAEFNAIKDYYPAMPYKGQGEDTIDIEPVVLDVDKLLSNAPTEIVRTLEKEYTDLAAAGADTATLSALAREIDSKKQDVIESRRAEITDGTEDAASSNRLVGFVKQQEGFKPNIYKDGNRQAIGYGHNLSPKEIETQTVYGYDISGPITQEVASDILRKDLAAKKNTLTSRFNNKYDISFDSLPQKSQEMLLDFEFNLGNVVEKFPKFTQAIVDGDMEKAKKEYKRYYGAKKIPLRKRNRDFYNTYLK